MRARSSTLAGLAAALLAPALVGLAHSPASAAGTDSIVYLQDGRVWIAQADGSGARPFTLAQYGWESPSEDDQGNVVVVGGLGQTNESGLPSAEIYRFAPDGNQVGAPTPTWGSYSGGCGTLGPDSARVSPDGTKVAYGIEQCGGGTVTTLWTPAGSTTLDFPHQQLGQEDFYQPQWLDSSQFLVNYAGNTPSQGQVRWFLHPTSGDDYAYNGAWYDDRVTGTGAVSVMNRQGTVFAIFADDGADWLDGKPRSVQLFLYSSPDLATAESSGWNLDCTINLSASDTSDPHHLSPSFSSDGTKLYWGDDKGVEAAPVSDRSNGCSNVIPTLLIPGGSQPFVSPGGVHTPAANPNQPGVQQPTPHPAFTVLTAHPRADHAVHFDGSSSYETGGQITKYAWSFGDGATAKGALVKHKFAKPGIYKVRLSVTDAAGQKARVTHSVTVKRG